MIVPIHWRFVWRSSFILAIVSLTLAAPGRASAQASAQCTNQGVGNSTTGNLTWSPQFCQEFNDVALTAIDTNVWSFDLGNGTGMRSHCNNGGSNRSGNSADDWGRNDGCGIGTSSPRATA